MITSINAYTGLDRQIIKRPDGGSFEVVNDEKERVHMKRQRTTTVSEPLEMPSEDLIERTLPHPLFTLTENCRQRRGINGKRKKHRHILPRFDVLNRRQPLPALFTREDLLSNTLARTCRVLKLHKKRHVLLTNPMALQWCCRLGVNVVVEYISHAGPIEDALISTCKEVIRECLSPTMLVPAAYSHDWRIQVLLRLRGESPWPPEGVAIVRENGFGSFLEKVEHCRTELAGRGPRMREQESGNVGWPAGSLFSLCFPNVTLAQVLESLHVHRSTYQAARTVYGEQSEFTTD